MFRSTVVRAEPATISASRWKGMRHDARHTIGSCSSVATLSSRIHMATGHIEGATCWEKVR